jgi:hypothetical protein
MPKANPDSAHTPVNERLPELGRRTFLAGLAVTIPTAAATVRADLVIK